MSTTTPLIDYRKIAEAQVYYTQQGFSEIPVPWIIGYEAYRVTRPTDRQEFHCLNGYLNASGEQSFIELALSGTRLTRHLCVTPCFRQEPVLDELHQRYFVKLELIDTDVSEKNMHGMIHSAMGFLSQFIECRYIQTDKAGQAFDIVDKERGIELGSYGIRRHGDFHWIYGTGVALPRLDTAIEMTKNGQQTKRKE